jgi:nitronate monooxygenase
MLGASAVQIGTAFLRCEEANVKDAHRAALREASDCCTVVTEMLTGRPARYIRNALADDLIASGLPPVAFSRADEPDVAAAGHRRPRDDAIVCRTIGRAWPGLSAGALVEEIAEEAGRRLGYGG